jgi:hypothetical protein
VELLITRGDSAVSHQPVVCAGSLVERGSTAAPRGDVRH